MILLLCVEHEWTYWAKARNKIRHRNFCHEIFAAVASATCFSARKIYLLLCATSSRLIQEDETSQVNIWCRQSDDRLLISHRKCLLCPPMRIRYFSEHFVIRSLVLGTRCWLCSVPLDDVRSTGICQTIAEAFARTMVAWPFCVPAIIRVASVCTKTNRTAFGMPHCDSVSTAIN